MAETKMLPIGPDFNMNELVGRLTQKYQAQGFDVVPMQMGDSVSIKFSKDNDGIKKFVGLCLEVTANLSVNNGQLIINFTDAEWTGKIIGLAVGWFLCLIPFLIAIYGAVKQSEFPKTITNDIRALMSGGSAPFGG